MSSISLLPPFTRETALIKVKKAQDLWNSKDAKACSLAYTENSVWRNRTEFFTGREKIVEFLTNKWKNEKNYRLRKKLFAFEDNKIAVQFWYEWSRVSDNQNDGEGKDRGGEWIRSYGLEDWTFAEDGRMSKRHMSANDVVIDENDRWFKDGIDIDLVEIPDIHG